jgi:glycosyltransferase involved in cell wall biosynthesis
MIEAMACGTPVIGWRKGAAPEVITECVTGFIVNSIEDAVQAAGRVYSLSRRDCRKMFEERFDATRMARDYVEVCQRLAHAGAKRATPYRTSMLIL